MKESYLLLQSIDSTSNRHRIYRIHILEVETDKTNFIVSCSWGRFQRFSHRKQFVFEDKKLLNRFLQSLIILRKRHQYVIVKQSSNFPNVKPVGGFKIRDVFPLQATLF